MTSSQNWFKSIGSQPTRSRIAAIWLTAIAFTFTNSDNECFAQSPVPAPAVESLADITRCLTGEGCARALAGTESAPPAACAADATVKTMPELLRSEIRSFAQSTGAAKCEAAERATAPLGEKIRDAYEGGATSTLTPEQFAAARNYVDACLSPEFLASAGPVSESEEATLNKNVGLIYERYNPQWNGPRPICTALAIGQFVVTAKSCLPAAVMAQSGRGAYLEDIAFRFFSRPTAFGLALHRFGTEQEPSIGLDQDIALLEAVAAPELTLPDISVPRLGTIRLNEDLFALSTSILLRVAAGVRSGTEYNFRYATRIYHSVPCRPAHIAADGIFLHACRLASGVTRGAPLFQRQEGRLVFVGIHSGATASLADRSLASCAAGLPNYGIAIPPALLVRAFLK